MEKKKKYCSGCESEQYIWKAHEGNCIVLVQCFLYCRWRGVYLQTDLVAVGKQTVPGTESSTFVFDTDNNNTVVGMSGALKLTLHF